MDCQALVVLPRGTVEEIVKNLWQKLSAGEEKEEHDTLEVATHFLMCYKRYISSSALCRLLKTDLQTHSPLSVGILRFLRLWILDYFVTDFWRIKRTKGKTRLATTLDLLDRVRRKTPALLFDVGRIQLALYKRWSDYKRPIGSRLSEIAVLQKNVTGSERSLQTFFSYPAKVVAEQLTLLEFNMWRRISPEEFMHKGWETSAGRKHAHLAHLVARANRMSDWVASSILCQKTENARVRSIQRFIFIAQCCEELGNYNGLMGIVGGLQQWCISRLISSHNISKRFHLVMRHLEFVMSHTNNYGAYRKMLSKRLEMLAEGTPTLPYVGLYLKDLTFIEDGNVDVFADKRLNVEKLSMLGRTMQSVRAFQQVDYSKIIKTKITPLLKHLAALPRWTQDELTKASEAIKARKEISAQDTSVVSTGSASDISDVSTATTGSDDGDVSGDEMLELSTGGESGPGEVLDRYF